MRGTVPLAVASVGLSCILTLAPVQTTHLVAGSAAANDASAGSRHEPLERTLSGSRTTDADRHFGAVERADALRTARAQAPATAQALRLSSGERLHPVDVMRDTDGTVHTRYERTIDGLPVIGGDLVVHRAASGAVTDVDYASRAAFSGLPAASSELTRTRPAPTDRLVVFASDHHPVLAWESHRRDRTTKTGPIDRLTYRNAFTGRRIARWDTIATADGTGASLYAGTVALSTRQSGSTYELTDDSRGGSSTFDAGNVMVMTSGALFTDPDNQWGDGATTSRQSAAVDAAYGAATTWDFYRSWFGRLGIRNDGVGADSRVHYGVDFDNAFWDDDCFCMSYGDGDAARGPLVSLDIAGHEMSHGVTSATAGLVYAGESGGLNESTSDIFGSLVEFSARNPSDPGDYFLGEKVSPDSGFLRRMDDPALDGASVNCWGPQVGSLNVHASSGIGNHFFYLLAEGSGAKVLGGRRHDSPTCNDSDVVGVGRTAAGRIWYRALTTYMTTTTRYAGARDATIRAARDLFGATSPQCSATVAAWNAVAVPVGAQACRPPQPEDNLLANPGFESENLVWQETTGVVTGGPSAEPHGGAYVAWLCGYGDVHTDRLSQSVTVPSGGDVAELSFWLKITSTESSMRIAYDLLKVRVQSDGTTSTLATYSNIDKGAAYVHRTVDLSSYVGQQVTVVFLGSEDSWADTAFRIDDVSLTAPQLPDPG